MSKHTENIACIYCRESKPRPSKGEHIILSALGGRATIRDVCGECNHALGRDIDEPFLQKSLIGIYRLVCPSVVDGAASSPQYVNSPYGMLDALLLNDGSLDPSPQIALCPSGTALVANPRESEFVQEVLNEFAGPNPPRVHRVIKDVRQFEPARIVFDRTRRSHLIRARTEEDADELRRRLQVGIPVGEFELWDLPRIVTFRSEMDLNATGRCVAKMAFNAACYVFGSEVIRTEYYNPVRDYIRGLNVISGPTTDENGEEGVLVDFRFVDPWLDEELRANSPPHADWQSIELSRRGSELFATVQLFGGYFEFGVHLGPFPGWCTDRVPIRIRSEYDGDWWELCASPNVRWSSNGLPPWGTQK